MKSQPPQRSVPSRPLGPARNNLLSATERELRRIEARIHARKFQLGSAAEIGVAVGAGIDARKVAKHFDVDIRDGHFSWRRRSDRMEEQRP